MKILIADDELNNRKMLRAYLKSFGQCDMVSDGKEALELFISDLEDGDPYDLVLLDIIMPNMDGQKTLSKMRAAEKRIAPDARPTPIMMITGMDSSVQAMQAYFKGGCTDYLTKPVTRELLLEKLRKLNLITDEESEGE
ncbi:MAG: response regulator [Magnetococcales bacterium]|nr:response regulator [Magnetococcales bacterium]